MWSVERLPVTPKATPVADDVKKWPHLHDLKFPTIDEEEVMLLIGPNAPEASYSRYWRNVVEIGVSLAQ